jgi:predicted nucleotidyltransferase component of viral defense system
MSQKNITNQAASVAARLLQRSHSTGEDYQGLLTRYGLERLMYRLSKSALANRFVVKGALAFLVWADEPFRATRDLDLLAMPEPSQDELLELFHSLCHMEVADDGLSFDEKSITIAEIREDQHYGGLCVNLIALLGKIRIPIQVDIGFGDAVTPEPQSERFPVLLDFSPPVLRLYPRETVVAEKVDAIVQLGLINSRIKDYYDLWVLMRSFEFDGELLKTAITATFNRRRTQLPTAIPPGLTDQFGGDSQKQAQWMAFLRRTHAKIPAGLEFKVMVKEISAFLIPPLMAAGKAEPFLMTWEKGGPWQTNRAVTERLNRLYGKEESHLDKIFSKMQTSVIAKEN